MERYLRHSDGRGLIEARPTVVPPAAAAANIRGVERCGLIEASRCCGGRASLAQHISAALNAAASLKSCGHGSQCRPQAERISAAKKAAASLKSPRLGGRQGQEKACRAAAMPRPH